MFFALENEHYSKAQEFTIGLACLMKLFILRLVNLATNGASCH